jgi:hypothetical protein
MHNVKTTAVGGGNLGERLSKPLFGSRAINRPGTRHQAGASQLEIMGVIAVGLVILIGGAIAFSSMTNGGEINNDMKNVGTLMVMVRDSRDIGGYGPANTDLTAGIVSGNKGQPPGNMTYTGGVLYNTWNGAVQPVSTGLGWTLTLNQLPQDACQKEAMKFSQAGNNVSTSINGGAAISGAVSKANATAGCSSTTANKVVFTYTT